MNIAKCTAVTLFIAHMGAALVVAPAARSAPPTGGGNPSPQVGGTVYVTSQNLTYNTFVPVEMLPPHGQFQLLEMSATGSSTEFGPGDAGYRGGRWWVDVNMNQEQDPGIDMFFLCPLLPPGF